MAYEIHIQRRNTPITLAEWRDAIERTENVRLADGQHKVTNPQTGEIITFGNPGGDAEVFFPVDGTWKRILCWSRRGAIPFAAAPDFAEPDSHLRHIATTLAQNLGALLVADEGESYV